MGRHRRSPDTFTDGMGRLALAGISTYAAYLVLAWALRHGFGFATSGRSLRTSIDPSQGLEFLGVAAAIVGLAFTLWRSEAGSANPSYGKYLQATAEGLGLFCVLSAIAVVADPAGRSLLGGIYLALSCTLAGLAVMIACWIEQVLDGTEAGYRELERLENTLKREQELLTRRRLSGVDLGSIVRAWMLCTAAPVTLDVAAWAGGWMRGSLPSDSAETSALAALTVGYGLLICGIVRVARLHRWFGLVRLAYGSTVAVAGLILAGLGLVAVGRGIVAAAFVTASVAALALPALPLWLRSLRPTPAGTASLLDWFMLRYATARRAQLRCRREHASRRRGS